MRPLPGVQARSSSSSSFLVPLGWSWWLPRQGEAADVNSQLKSKRLFRRCTLGHVPKCRTEPERGGPSRRYWHLEAWGGGKPARCRVLIRSPGFCPLSATNAPLPGCRGLWLRTTDLGEQRSHNTEVTRVIEAHQLILGVGMCLGETLTLVTIMARRSNQPN